MPDLIIILRTNKPYSPEHQEVLLNCYRENISLYCAVGTFAEQWEDAMDNLISEEPEHNRRKHITTTSHIDEPFEEVLNMARHWNLDNGTPSIQIIDV